MTTATEELASLLDRARVAAASVGTDAEGREVAAMIAATARKLAAAKWQPYPWQHPHVHPPGWVSTRAPGVCDERCALLPPATIPVQGYWLQRGGRGTGKTEGAAHYVNLHAEGPACDPRVPGGHRITIVAPTQADAVSSCVTGVSGLQTINPGVRITTNREGTTARWPSGTVARVVGAHTDEDVNRLRAWTNVCCVWIEEAAAMVHLPEVLDQVPFTLRLGDRPHGVVTTTPKNRPEVTALIDGHPDLPTIKPAAVQTWGRTRDAVRLAPAVRAALEDKYADTILGEQELDGKQLRNVEGALWVVRQTYTDPKDARPGIDNDRVPVAAVGYTSHDENHPTVTAAETLHRVVVGVDPSGGGDDEAGIVVAGSIGNHGYAVADLSGQMSSDQWARRAVQAYYDFGAEGIALEKSGGDNPSLIIRSVELADGRSGASVPLFLMPTKVGKRLRAEPVSALYEQHRIHHVGTLPQLEDQMTTWVPDQTTDSPDRVDALVHALTYLLVRVGAGRVSSPVHRTIPR